MLLVLLRHISSGGDVHGNFSLLWIRTGGQCGMDWTLHVFIYLSSKNLQARINLTTRYVYMRKSQENEALLCQDLTGQRQ